MGVIHVFGGGPLLGDVSDIATTHGWQVVWRTSQRLQGSSLLPSTDSGRIAGPFIAKRLDDAMHLGTPPDPRQDLALSLGAPWIFTRAWLQEWGGRAFNLHSTPLPRHRGGGGGSWQVMMQDATGAATLHVLTEGIDDGEIVAQQKFKYSTPMTAETWLDETTAASRKLLHETLPELLHGRWELTPQPERHILHWPRLHTDTHGWIDWRWSRDDVLNFIRAFGSPHPGASTFLRGSRVRVNGAQPLTSESFHPFQAGLIVSVGTAGCAVVTESGLLEVTGPWIEAARSGDRLFTPTEVLDSARATRAHISPTGKWTFSEAGPVT